MFFFNFTSYFYQKIIDKNLSSRFFGATIVFYLFVFNEIVQIFSYFYSRSYNKSLIFFRDLEDTIWPVYKTNLHKGVINSIDGVSGTTSGCGSPEIVTGARDGKILFRY